MYNDLAFSPNIAPSGKVHGINGRHGINLDGKQVSEHSKNQSAVLWCMRVGGSFGYILLKYCIKHTGRLPNIHHYFLSTAYFKYCISCYFREGFIFANFASQTLAKISTSIHVYLKNSNDNIRKIAKLTTRELPQKSKNAEITVRENNGLYKFAKYSLYFEETFCNI